MDAMELISSGVGEDGTEALTATPRKKEAPKSEEKGTVTLQLLHHAENSFGASVSIADSDQGIEVYDKKISAEPSAIVSEKTSSTASEVLPSEQLVQAEALYCDDKIFAAYRLLAPIAKANPDLMTQNHQRILREAELCLNLVERLPLYPNNTKDEPHWHEHHETHRNRKFIIRHQLTKGVNGTTLDARIDCAIEPSLLLPLLSVLNETELFHTWLPNWDVPIHSFEAVLRALAVDDIEESGSIVIRLESLDTGGEDGLVKEPQEKGTFRVDFSGGFVLRKCPRDHPAAIGRKRKRAKKFSHLSNAVKDHLTGHKHKLSSTEKPTVENDNVYMDEEEDKSQDLILVSFAMHSDPRATALPKQLTSFVVKTAIGTMWSHFLNVASDIRDNKRPRHMAAMDSKRALYDWVEERVRCMLTDIDK